MLKNYLIVTFRNLFKTKLFSFINIIGLTIGISACLLIIYYVQFEKSYDKFYNNMDRVYRVRYERTDAEGQTARFASCCPPGAIRIRSMLPEAEKTARIFRYQASVLIDNSAFFEERMFFVENEFFDIFSYSFISGDPSAGISEPNTAFISESTAKKYFGNQNPIGKTIRVDKKIDYRITGVFIDSPRNSHLKMDVALSFPNLYQLYGNDIDESWGDTGFYTYILLKNLTDPQLFEKKLNQIVEDEIGEAFRAYKLKVELIIQPLADIHLKSHVMQEFEANGDADTVDFLSIIAGFILVVACINYINLSTSRSLARAKETGLRKVIGASRLQLITQFFFETLIINIISILLALALIFFILPYFNKFNHLPDNYSIFQQTWFWLILTAIFFICVILSGIYPALVLSSFKPVSVLKGKFANSAKGIRLRKGLVVGQFIIAISLISLTLTVFNQLSYMKNQEPGFRKEQVLCVRLPRVRTDGFGSKAAVFKDRAIRDLGVINASIVTEAPGKQIYWDAGDIHRVNTDEGKNYYIVGIDYDFINVFDTKIIAGRNFSKEFTSDSGSLLLNETAVKWLGFENAQSAIGQQVSYWDQIFTVVGVLKNYHQQSSKFDFEPQIYRLMLNGRGLRGFFALYIPSQDVQTTLKKIQNTYFELFPDNPFDFFFLDDYYNRQYESDEKFGAVFGIFSFLTIFITCLGILGLSYFMTLQRTREIGIRKVLGANANQIIRLLLKEYLYLLFIAFSITLPISYFGMNYWLNSFASRIELTIGLFVAPLAISAGFMVITVIAQVIKAASVNPIQTIRYE